MLSFLGVAISTLAKKTKQSQPDVLLLDAIVRGNVIASRCLLFLYNCFYLFVYLLTYLFETRQCTLIDTSPSQSSYKCARVSHNG